MPDEVIVIDGKSLRETRQISQRPLHLLHARGCTNRVCLGQIQVDEKSNEMTAISEILGRLYLKGSMITTDVLNMQKAVAAKAIEKGANYVLPVKENHPNFLESLKFLYKDAEERGYVGIDADHFESLEKSRGRVEERSCIALDTSNFVEAKEWKGLKTAAKIVRKRTVKDKTTEEIIYSISSLELDASKIGKAAREH